MHLEIISIPNRSPSQTIALKNYHLQTKLYQYLALIYTNSLHAKHPLFTYHNKDLKTFPKR